MTKKTAIAAALLLTAGAMSFTGCAVKLSLPPSRPQEIHAQPAPPVKHFSDWINRDFSAENWLLHSLRDALAGGPEINDLPPLNVALADSWVALTLFESGNDPIRWIARRPTPAQTLNHLARKLREHERFARFHVSDSARCRLMFEIVTAVRPIDVRRMSINRLDDNRLEPGVTGLWLEYGGANHFYMPTDAAVYSHMTVQHVLNHLSKKTGVANKTNKISERVKLMKDLPATWRKIESVAFVTYGDQLLPLYRGYPVPVEFSEDNLRRMVHRSAKWLCDNMTADGRFLYYYDAVADSVIDHTHPDRTEEDNYYNILRHSGGAIALLRAYELDPRPRYLAACEKALDHLVAQTRDHSWNGRKACYVFDNQKAKLGGTGIGLAALLRYRQTTADKKYDAYIYGLANHLLSRICDDGEMLGYYIHPLYNDGKPILSPTPREKKQLFSFYYPGEALMGLALFEKQMPIDPAFRREVRASAAKALDFLVNVRPVRYADLFEPLPSDGWLMQAVEEWADIEEFRKPEYLDFVFSDANQLIAHMYTEQDSPCYDYPGTFYYNYGDHAYVDAARGEGLIAAYFLARKLGRDRLAARLLADCRTVAKSVMYSYNSPESAFMHPRPEKSVGSFRFKFTRHWVRVDTAQHASCFFARTLNALIAAPASAPF